MRPPLFILNLKADLSLEDCVDFLNEVTEHGEKRFSNFFVALPYIRLVEMGDRFKDSGIVFGAAQLTNASPGSFTAPIAAELVKEAAGSFCLIGTTDERLVLKLDYQSMQDKILVALRSGLKALFCLQGDTSETLQEQLQFYKDSDILALDSHPLLIFRPSWSPLESYLPSKTEIENWRISIDSLLSAVFEQLASQIRVVIALPGDLIGFSQLVEELPFDGAFFEKTGKYPHAVHRETVELIHVNCTESSSHSCQK